MGVGGRGGGVMEGEFLWQRLLEGGLPAVEEDNILSYQSENMLSYPSLFPGWQAHP